ncbi:hypothetical protein GCM10010211_21220 [Streptomyces albospinus]|uniref:von Willebrand factor type A C-terminal domain-containing protein n=1 Tax=Streptomyces albospinus TaxID=285515 RepID=A0ABQ2UXR5_9ACTN|nr:hypothetical protein [Streptomyces albospinus]GGU56135.1 hypothetical protein GCM10010211_21220 [Streptomyces albospinus]
MANFAKSRVPRFSAEVHQNPCLPEGGREVHAIVTVTATGGGTTGGRPVPAPRTGPDGPVPAGRHGSVPAGPDGGAARIADVGLRVWTPRGAEVAHLRQVAPTVADLTARRRASGPLSGDYPTGSWGDESRDYHLCLRVPDAGLGRRMLAARVSLVLSGPDGSAPRTVSQGLVKAVWTDDPAAAAAIDPQVAHYTGQAELAQVIQQGLDARKSGDAARAVAKLGRAVQLARAAGNGDIAKLLAKVVDVVDAATGTVRLKAKVTEAGERTLGTHSTTTVRVTEHP